MVAGLSVIAGCAAPSAPPSGSATDADSDTRLFDPRTVLQDEWQHVPLRGETDYRIAVHDGQLAISAKGANSASMLIRHIGVNLAKCPRIRWSWTVAKLQEKASLRDKNREDVAASVFVAFGDPGFLFDPEPVPIIRYVWTNKNEAVGAIVDNPYLPGVVRSVVVRSDYSSESGWMTEERNLVDDFKRAFGDKDHDEPKRIYAVALFTDNDQTKEPVEAYYGNGWVVCDRP